MALTKVLTGGIALDAVDNTILKLDDDYALTGTVTGAGKILQVLQATDETQRTVNSTSYDARSSSLSVAITPAASTSKFLVSFDTESYNAQNSVSLYVTIFRDSTDIGHSSGYGLARVFSSASDISVGANGVKLDSPSTDSEITYTVQTKLSTGTGPAYINSQSIGTLTVMEVAG